MIRQVFHRGSMQYLTKKVVQKRHTLKHYNALLPTRVAPNCTQKSFRTYCIVAAYKNNMPFKVAHLHNPERHILSFHVKAFGTLHSDLLFTTLFYFNLLTASLMRRKASTMFSSLVA